MSETNSLGFPLPDIPTPDYHVDLNLGDGLSNFMEQQRKMQVEQMRAHMLQSMPFNNTQVNPSLNLDPFGNPKTKPRMSINDLKKELIRYKQDASPLRREGVDDVILNEVKLMISKMELVELTSSGKITKEEQTKILRMLNSEDPESRLLAVEIIHIR